MNFILFNWDEYPDILERPEFQIGRELLIDQAEGFMNQSEWYKFDPTLKSLSPDQRIKLISEIGVLPFSPVEQPKCKTTQELYDWWVESMDLTTDTLTVKHWKNSPVFRSRHKWRLIAHCQLTSLLLYQVAKYLNPNSIPQIVQGNTHTFVLCDNVIYDLLWYWEPIESFIKEFEYATYWLDPVAYLREGYDVLSPYQEQLLDQL